MGKPSMTDDEKNIQGEKVTENIFLCPDGKYRWYYAFQMLRNPTILFTVWKVLGLSFGVVYLMTFLLSLGDVRYFGWGSIWSLTKGFLLLALVFLVLGALAYLILAWLYGWQYIVLFEMDEKEVVHIQMPKQFKKAEAIGWLTAVVGVLSGKPAMAGLGIQTAVKSSTTSEFANVRRLKALRRRHTIKVNQLLNRNQVYAEEADFDFVWRYIVDHCPQAKRS